MITDSDLVKIDKKLEKKFVTKTEFNSRFDVADKRSDSYDKHLEQLEERFARLTELVLEGFEQNRKEHEELKGMFRKLQDNMDAIMVRTERFWHEHVALTSKVDRHYRRIDQIGETLDIKLVQ